MKKFAVFLMVAALSTSTMTVYALNKKTSIYSMSEVLTLVSKNYKGEITKIDLETDNNKNIYYEVDVLGDGKKTELIVDAKTGKVVNAYDESLDDEDKFISDTFSQNGTQSNATSSESAAKSTQKIITEEAAKKIALAKVPGGKIIKCYLDYDQKTTEYEIEILLDKYEYEIDIDATTGTIVSYDKDHIYD